jgi:hypothetical protein
VPGSLLLLGNDTSQSQTGRIDLYTYNVAMSQWSNKFDYVHASVQVPFIFTIGGYAVTIDESQPNLLYIIDTAAPANTPWTTITITSIA